MHSRHGVRHKTKPQFKFQSRGRRGEQKLVHIPAELVPRVRKLIANGKRVEALEAEYARLVTEESLAALKISLHPPPRPDLQYSSWLPPIVSRMIESPGT